MEMDAELSVTITIIVTFININIININRNIHIIIPIAITATIAYCFIWKSIRKWPQSSRGKFGYICLQFDIEIYMEIDPEL